MRHLPLWPLFVSPQTLLIVITHEVWPVIIILSVFNYSVMTYCLSLRQGIALVRVITEKKGLKRAWVIGHCGHYGQMSKATVVQSCKVFPCFWNSLITSDLVSQFLRLIIVEMSTFQRVLFYVAQMPLIFSCFKEWEFWLPVFVGKMPGHIILILSWDNAWTLIEVEMYHAKWIQKTIKYDQD